MATFFSSSSSVAAASSSSLRPKQQRHAVKNRNGGSWCTKRMGWGGMALLVLVVWIGRSSNFRSTVDDEEMLRLLLLTGTTSDKDGGMVHLRNDVPLEDKQRIAALPTTTTRLTPALTTTTTMTTTTSTLSSRVLFYVPARTDRAGSAVHDMLLAHAFGWARNWTLAGICPEEPHLLIHRRSNEDLLEWMGLDRILWYRCPSPTEAAKLRQWQSPETPAPLVEEDNDDVASTTSAVQYLYLANASIYRGWDLFTSDYLTPTWQHYLQHHVLHPHTWQRPFLPVDLSASDGNTSTTTRPDFVHQPSPRHPKTTTFSTLSVAVHIRRGDAGACEGPNARRRRYLPLSHYRRLLEEHVVPLTQSHHVDIFVFSERQAAHEPWDRHTLWWKNETNLPNHEGRMRWFLRLDTDLQETWHGLLSADVVLMSRSTMSFVASLFNSNAQRILYTPFWIPPVHNWIIPTDAFMEQTVQELKHLQQEVHCFQ